MAKTREYRSADYEIFARAAKQLEMSGPELASAIGYSKAVAAKWQHAGRMPYVASLAAECLLRRQGANGRALIRAEKFEVIEGQLHCQRVMDGVWLVK